VNGARDFVFLDGSEDGALVADVSVHDGQRRTVGSKVFGGLLEDGKVFAFLRTRGGFGIEYVVENDPSTLPEKSLGDVAANKTPRRM